MKSIVLGVLAGACLSAHAASGVDDRSPAASPAAIANAGRAAAPAVLTVKNVLDRGGKQLNAEEMKAFIPGTQWYASIVGKPYVVTNHPDGTWRGEAGRLPPFQGTWRIDGSGRYCSRLTERSGIAVTAEESCLYYFKVGSDYFVSNERDPSTDVMPQRLLK